MTLTSSEVSDRLRLVEIKPGLRYSIAVLRDLLPDVSTMLFFARVYKLGYTELSSLLSNLFPGRVLAEVLNETDHSDELQDYLVDVVPTHVAQQYNIKLKFKDAPPPDTVLPELWDAMNTEIARSIQEVADKLGKTLSRLPGKEGRMIFKHLAIMNRSRPTVGDYKAGIQRSRRAANLVILDDSGSMTQPTIQKIVAEVVALAVKADAHLVLVSNTARVWEPGCYSVADVLRAAEYGGTQYEQLVPLLQQDWGTVVTIADYDSSASAMVAIRDNTTGHIGLVLDISLVNRPSYLAECVGQRADEVRTLLIGSQPRL